MLSKNDIKQFKRILERAELLELTDLKALIENKQSYKEIEEKILYNGQETKITRVEEFKGL